MLSGFSSGLSNQQFQCSRVCFNRGFKKGQISRVQIRITFHCSSSRGFLCAVSLVLQGLRLKSRSIFKRFILIILNYVYMSLWKYTHLNADSRGGRVKGITYSGAGFTNDCETLNIGTENSIWIFCKQHMLLITKPCP